MSKYSNLKKRCTEANLEINKQNLVIYTFGNLSIIDRKLGVFAIKPSGVGYDVLEEEMIVIVGLNGDVIEGELRPSSDTKTHCYLYNQWNNINSICHTHSTYAVGWAQSLLNVPIYGTTHADHLTRKIPCTKAMSDELIKGDYEFNTGVQIVEHFESNGLNPLDIEMVLVGNHGPFTWGEDEKKCVYNSKVLEELCKMAFITKTLNPKIGNIKSSLIKKHYFRKHGADSYYGQ